MGLVGWFVLLSVHHTYVLAICCLGLGHTVVVFVVVIGVLQVWLLLLQRRISAISKTSSLCNVTAITVFDKHLLVEIDSIVDKRLLLLSFKNTPEGTEYNTWSIILSTLLA